MGFHSRSPRKVPLLKTKHVKDRLKFVETYENIYIYLRAQNLVIAIKRPKVVFIIGIKT